MAEKIKLNADLRENTARQARRAGSIPGVLYGHATEAKSVQVDAKRFTKIFAQSGYTSLINLELGDKVHNVLVREVQFHPLKSLITHVDFYQVRLDEKVEADVPLAFTGEAAAVKDLGGVLVKNIDTLAVEAFPQDLPHNIPVDISVLATFETVIHVRDLQLPSGVELLQSADDVVALVQPPRSEQELEALAEEVKEDVAAVEAVEKPKAEEEPAEGAEGAAPAPATEKKE